MNKLIVFIFFLMFWASAGISQQYISALPMDSLKAAFNKANDTGRVNTLNLVGRMHLYGDNIRYHRIAAQSTIVITNINQGNKKLKNDHASARIFADEALALSKVIGYKKGIGNALLNIGVLGKLKGMPAFLEALPLLKQAGEKYSTALCFQYIAEMMLIQLIVQP